MQNVKETEVEDMADLLDTGIDFDEMRLVLWSSNTNPSCWRVYKFLIRPDGIYVDGMGGGGHSAELRRLGPKGLLIGLDQDKNAINAAESRLLDINSKAEVVIEHTNFENIREVLKAQKIDSVDGILLDLGVSSHQLDEGERGFSYQHDAPLDMRMNQSDSFNAQILLNSWSKDEIARVIRDYGEEKWAARIADFIVRNREAQKITTTGQLVDIIKERVPAAARREGPHPASDLSGLKNSC